MAKRYEVFNGTYIESTASSEAAWAAAGGSPEEYEVFLSRMAALASVAERSHQIQEALEADMAAGAEGEHEYFGKKFIIDKIK